MNGKFSKRRCVFLTESYKDSVSGTQLKRKKMGHGLVGWCINQLLLGQQTHLESHWLAEVHVNFLLLYAKLAMEALLEVRVRFSFLQCSIPGPRHILSGVSCFHYQSLEHSNVSGVMCFQHLCLELGCIPFVKVT